MRLLSLLFFLVLVFRLSAAISEFKITGTNPDLTTFTQTKLLGSALEFKLQFQADAGIFQILAYRNSNLARVIASQGNIAHTSGVKELLFRVPVEEGDNDYFLRLVENSNAGGEKTTSLALPVRRDLEYEALDIRLNQILNQAGQVILYTREPTVRVFFTVNGNSEQVQITPVVNGIDQAPFTASGKTSSSQGGIPLQTNTVNLIQLKVRTNDPNGVNLGVQSQSNILRVFHDTVPPAIVDLGTTFQSTPPGAGIPWGPTALATIGLVVGTDTPFARILVFNTNTGEEITRLTQADGRITISGLELPKDPSLPALTSTTTTYTVQAFDDAGNTSLVRSIQVERIAIEPCFNLLRMRPQDGQLLGQSLGVSISGAVCDENKPHRVVFSIASPFSANTFLKEEQIRNLGGGEVFDKDISIPINPALPNENVPLSVQAVVIVTNPFDPNREEMSIAHDLGTVILDRKSPASPTILTERAIFSTNAPSFTIDGQTEREANVLFNFPGSFVLKPSREVPATQDEFRAVVDLSSVLDDGVFEVDVSARDKAGNLGIASTNRVVLKIDRRNPQIKQMRINGSPVEQTRPFFFRSGQTVSIQVLVDEALLNPPRVFVTQQGSYGVEAGLARVLQEGLDFEYQFVVQESVDGNLDGPVDILIAGGRDQAGNPLSPSFRESRAFIVDTLAPVLQRNLILPRDGSILSKAPTPLRMVMSEHPKTKDQGSGPHPENCSVKGFGPIESAPARPVGGRLEVYDPRTLDFYPEPKDFNLDGTYIFEVKMVDRAGNSFVESVVLELDQEKLSTSLIRSQFPRPNSFFNAQTLPKIGDKPYVSIGIEPLLTAEIDLPKTRMQVFNYLRVPQEFLLSTGTVTSTTAIQFVFRDPVKADGSDDGALTAIAKIQDIAGNLSEEKVWSFVYDTKSPAVMDGLSFPVPDGYSVEDLRFPANRAVVSGPLREVSALVFDGKSPTGFLGSGLQTSIASSAITSTTTITLSLLRSLSSLPPTTLTSGRIKFKGDITGSAPLYGGPLISRVLFELNVNSSLNPVGLETDGFRDGFYQMQVFPFDVSGNAGKVSTSVFLYDTVAPLLTVEANNEIWVTSSVLEFSGKAQDLPFRPLDVPGFGSTLGTGLSKVEIKLEAVNSLGSATFPPLFNWTPIELLNNVQTEKPDFAYPFRFQKRFFDYSGRARFSVRAIDKAGNQSIVQKELSLELDRIKDPVLLAPPDGTFFKGGLVRFLWEPEEKASQYELLIEDANRNFRSFMYPQGSASADFNLDLLPDGNSFWKILAIDGSGHKSQGQNGRSFNLSRVFPEVSKITFEKPVLQADKAGIILQSQIRVQLVFSRDIDPQSPPKVLFLPASKTVLNSLGQSILETYAPLPFIPLGLEKDTWTGLIRFAPTAPDVDYNGMGKIIVSEARDVNGNQMSPYEHNFEIDNGPYFEFVVFSNPVNEKELVFIAKGFHAKGNTAEEITEIPFLQVRQQKIANSISDADKIQIVSLNRLNKSSFQGMYTLDLGLSGNLRLEITGRDKQGNQGTRLLPFIVRQIGFFSPNQLPSQSILQAEFPPSTRQNSLSRAMPLYHYLPLRQTSSQTSVIDLASLNLQPSLYAVMQKNESGLVFLPQTRSLDQITVTTGSRSDLYLIEDKEAPQVHLPIASDTVLEEDLTIEINDTGSGLARAEFRIENQVVEALRQGNTYTLPLHLFRPNQKNSLSVAATDYLENTRRLDVSVLTPSPIQFQEALAVPNPGRLDTWIMLNFNRKPVHLRLILQDASGRRISTLEWPGPETRNRIPVRDLVPQGAANGVYFIRAEATDSDAHKDRKALKFVLLR